MISCVPTRLSRSRARTCRRAVCSTPFAKLTFRTGHTSQLSLPLASDPLTAPSEKFHACRAAHHQSGTN